MAAPAIKTYDTIELAKGTTGLPEALIFPRLIRASDLEPDRSDSPDSSVFNLRSLRGRLVELSARRPSACLSVCCRLLVQAQGQSAPAVWISSTPDSFYPPDLAANGVDLSLLPVLWLPDSRSAGRAADWLLRTGAFGLLVVDLYGDFRMPTALQTRLAQLAHRHGAAVVFLTAKPQSAPSLGSMISLYARVHRSRMDGGHFRLSLQVLKDKRRAPVWEHVESLDGPPGLC